MTKTEKRMWEKAKKNQDCYDTKKYRYVIRYEMEGEKFYRVELWKFGTTAILEPDAWMEIK